MGRTTLYPESFRAPQLGLQKEEVELPSATGEQTRDMPFGVCEDLGYT